MRQRCRYFVREESTNWFPSASLKIAAVPQCSVLGGNLALDGYIVRTLMPDLVGHDRQASAFVVYLFLWERTGGARERNVPLSLRTIAEGSGLSKRAVQRSLAVLERRGLATARRSSPTAVPEYTVHRPWARRTGSGRRGEASE